MTKERLLRNHFLFCRKCHLSKQKENTYRIETRRDHMTRDFEHRSSSESSTKLISWKSLKATMSTTCHCAFQIRCQKGRKSRGCCWFGRLISRFLAQPKEALFILGILTFCVCFSFDRMPFLWNYLLEGNKWEKAQGRQGNVGMYPPQNSHEKGDKIYMDEVILGRKIDHSCVLKIGDLWEVLWGCFLPWLVRLDLCRDFCPLFLL